jgi:hypothetical protein
VINLNGVRMTPEQLANRIVASTIHHNIIEQTRQIHFKNAMARMTQREHASFQRHLHLVTARALAACNKN